MSCTGRIHSVFHRNHFIVIFFLDFYQESVHCEVSWGLNPYSLLLDMSQSLDGKYEYTEYMVEWHWSNSAVFSKGAL